MTKVLQQSAKIKTNSTPGSVCKVEVEVVKFIDLWIGYPKTSTPYRDPKTGKVPKIYDNQCAIRVSVSLHAVGVTMKSFKGASLTVDEKKVAIRAQELADWLKLQPFCGLPQRAEVITGADWQAKIKGRTGIIFFKDYWSRDGEVRNATGDHIDLWNGSKMTASSLTGAFHSFLRFTIGIDHIEGFYSDLGKAKQILFWEIK
jgi:hypothetical protein